jgi:hypothetical protein
MITVGWPQPILYINGCIVKELKAFLKFPCGDKFSQLSIEMQPFLTFTVWISLEQFLLNRVIFKELKAFLKSPCC